MSSNNFKINGLTNQQVIVAREKNGKNELELKKDNDFLDAIKSLAQEPMILLLLIASVIYYISGQTGDAIFLASAIIIVSVLSLYQDAKSKSALQKLKYFTQPNCKVIRNGNIEEIKSEELVVGDSLMVEEGTSVAADGIIVHSNDFSLNQSIRYYFSYS